MTEPALESIEIEGFLSISSASVSLGRLNVLIGANGAGKSNFITAFELLGRLADNQLRLFVGQRGGASALLNKTKGSQHIKFDLRGREDGYRGVLIPAVDEKLIFENEAVLHRTGPDAEFQAAPIGVGSSETSLNIEARLYPEAKKFASDLLKACKVYHFHDTSPDAAVKQFVPTADNISLRADAGNLAAVLLALRNSDDAAYRLITRAVRQVAPFFGEFVLEPENDRVRLRWSQVDSDAIFSASQMSDGTLRFICLATLLLQPALPALVILDEPELGLHPFAIVQLAGLLRQASVRSQVLMATQSVTLMNQFELADLIVVQRENGASTFTRPDPAKLSAWLEDYSLGELWEKNVIGGRPGGAGRI
ncbi:MAG TPA: AAA family ATPase [Pseudonocardiaceae bacterium]|nr:AAA family ATPase [Pseudonocardiaceae bacterium]